MAFSEQKSLIFVLLFDRGCPNKRAEIIPKSPDPGNAGVGKIKVHNYVVFSVYIFTNPLFYFTKRCAKRVALPVLKFYVNEKGFLIAGNVVGISFTDKGR